MSRGELYFTFTTREQRVYGSTVGANSHHHPPLRRPHLAQAGDSPSLGRPAAGSRYPMGWLWGSSLSAEEKASLRRRCASAVAAHRNCVAANGAAAAEACRNLEVSVLDCKATVVCPEAAAEHGRCLHSLVETGKYQGKRDCDAAIAAMRKCLRRKGVDLRA
eukprot:jgi/Tetstr1/458172/TSEL_044663.t1